MQWDRILNDVNHARDLSPEACAAFLSTLETTTDHAGEVRRLLTRLSSNFLATSADEDSGPAGFVGSPGLLVGQWRLQELLGRGGMGEVWCANRADGLYDQVAAVKLMQPGGADRLRRFDDERRRLARMEHRGIARIIDGGITDEGVAFMVMEFVDGEAITDFAAGKSLRDRVRLVAEVCDAVEHAHGRLVLHRDIKPGNVLVDRNGQARLIDFGIASALDDMEIGGPLTLAFAAPEQLRGEPQSVATDVFALGVLLCQLLGGILPVRDQDGAVIVDTATVQTRDLRAIILRATRAGPDERYASASALADDLRAFLEGRAVAARAGGPFYQLGKLAGRYPLASAGLASAVLALAVGIFASVNFAQAAQREAVRAQTELERAQFFLTRAETLNRAQGAYADVLRRLTGDNETDLARESRILMERWQEAHENREVNPAQAAALSYAIGTHFALRSDNERAVAVLEPWIGEGYGPKGLRDLASVHLASVYSVLGRRDDARALLEALEAEMEKGFDRHSVSHVQVVQDLAWLGDQGEGFRRAEEVTLAALEIETDPHYLSALWNFLGTARLSLRDRTGATEAYRQAVAAAENDPLADLANLGVVRVNLAAMELYFADDPEAAMRQIDIVLGPIRTAIGENSSTGFAHMIRGEAALAQGDVPTALAETAMALELIERFSGFDGGSWINAAPARAAALIAAGQTDEARRLVNRLEALLTDRKFPMFMAHICLARLAAAEGQASEAANHLAEARTHTEGLERGMPHAWRLAQAEAFVAASGASGANR